MARRMAWRRVSKPTCRYACICYVLWQCHGAQAQLTGPSHCCSTTRSPRYTAYTQRHVVVTIRCLTELSDHTYTHPPRPESLPLSLPPTDPGSPLTLHRGPGRQPYLRGK